MRISSVRSVLVSVAAAAAVNLHAAEISFQLYPTGNSNPDIASQFRMEVSNAGGNQALFKLFNDGPVSSTISDVLFYDGSLLGLTALQDKDDSVSGVFGLNTVDFSKEKPLHPDSLPQYPAAMFGADRDRPGGISNGIDPGEWLGFLFDLHVGKSFTDLLADLENGIVFIGLHVQRIGTDEGSDWYESTPPTSDSPVPDGGTTLILAGVALLGLAAFQRRFARS